MEQGYISLLVAVLSATATLMWVWATRPAWGDSGTLVFAAFLAFVLSGTTFHAVFFMSLYQILVPLLIGAAAGGVLCALSCFEKWLTHKPIPTKGYLLTIGVVSFCTLSATLIF